MADLVKHVSGEEFDQLIQTSDVPVLVDFWAPWCLPCHMMAPVLEQIAAKMQDKVKIVKLNVDEAPEVADRYGIRGIPTLILFSGGREVDRQIGFAPPAALEQWLSQKVSA